MPVRLPVTAAAAARIAARPTTTTAKEPDPRAVARVFRYSAATLKALTGQDEQPSELFKLMSEDAGAAPVELVQDAVLLSASVLEDVADGLEDGELTPAEARSAVFQAFADLPELLADVADL